MLTLFRRVALVEGTTNLALFFVAMPAKYSQYTSEQFQRLMADNGVTWPLSRSGNVWDNAAMESFFS